MIILFYLIMNLIYLKEAVLYELVCSKRCILIDVLHFASLSVCSSVSDYKRDNHIYIYINIDGSVSISTSASVFTG